MSERSDRHSRGRVLLGQAIRARRVELGLSLAELSARVDLSPFTVNSYELGRRLPSLEALDTLAVALDTSAREILTGVFPWGEAEEPSGG